MTTVDHLIVRIVNEVHAYHVIPSNLPPGPSAQTTMPTAHLPSLAEDLNVTFCDFDVPSMADI